MIIYLEKDKQFYLSHSIPSHPHIISISSPRIPRYPHASPRYPHASPRYPHASQGIHNN